MTATMRACSVPAFALFALAGLLAEGCVRYEARPLSAPQTLDALEARSLGAPDLAEYVRDHAGADAWPPEAWNLRSLTPAAFFYSPALDVARARWGVARAGEITAGARPNPDASALLGYNADAAPGVSPWIPEIVLDIPIETAGKRGIRVKEARSLSEAARLDVLSAAWKVRTGLREAFVELFAARESRSLIERKSGIEEESVRILERRLEAGDVSANEVTQARVALDRTRLDLLDAQKRSAEALTLLAGTIGVPAASLENVEFSFDTLESVRVDLPKADIRRRALVSRPDILRGLAEYEASQQALQLEIARQYPDIHIGPGYQLDQTDSKWTLGLTLTLPVFNKNRGPIAEAEARRTEAAARFMELQAGVLQEIDSAIASSRAAAESARAADQMVDGLRKREATAEASYGLGEIPKLALLGAQLELVSGELSRLDSIAGAQRALGALEGAVQSPDVIADWILETPERTPAGESAHG